MALGLGPGAEMRAPMARAAIGGIISSTILTLVVVPVVYTVINDIVDFLNPGKKKDKSGKKDEKLNEELDSSGEGIRI